MRTKTLLLTAALAAAGVVSSSAEVYSVNSVGYVNISLPIGYSLLANPLNAPNNTLITILPVVPDQSIVYRFVNGAFANPYTYYAADGAELAFWDAAENPPGTPVNYVFNPGEGFFISVAQATTVTFVGEVPQGNLSYPIPAGFALRASQVPQEARLGAEGVVGTLGFPAKDGDVVYTFASAGQRYSNPWTYFSQPTLDPGDASFWDYLPRPGEPANDVNGPVIPVGTSFWSLKTAATPWNRSFSVNN